MSLRGTAKEQLSPPPRPTFTNSSISGSLAVCCRLSILAVWGGTAGRSLLH